MYSFTLNICILFSSSFYSIDDLATNVKFVETDPQKDVPNGSYNVSKAALNQGTQILAKEWAKAGPRVNCVDPGWCSTDMGGPQATRSARDGALSIFALIEGAAAPGNATGEFLNSHGRKYSSW